MIFRATSHHAYSLIKAIGQSPESFNIMFMPICLVFMPQISVILITYKFIVQ